MQQIYSCPRCGATVSYGQSTCAYCGLVFYQGGTNVPPYGQYPPNQQQPWNGPPAYNQYSAGGNPNQYPRQYAYRPGATGPQKKSSSGLAVFLIVIMVLLCIVGVVVFMMNTNSSFKTPAAAPTQSATPAGSPSTSAPVNSTPPATATTPATGSGTSSTTDAASSGNLPTINSFTATPASVSSGQSSTLQWDISGATSASINGVGSVNSASGTQTVTPTENTVYTITATSSAGSVYASATVTASSPTSSGSQSGDQSQSPWKTWGKNGGQSSSQSSSDVTYENWGKSAK
jgi:zinc-ribbon domain